MRYDDHGRRRLTGSGRTVVVIKSFGFTSKPGLPGQKPNDSAGDPLFDVILYV